jgi:glycosyltransferase involved in cell wall biosynthesis
MLENSFRIIYSSEWAKDKTIEFYAIDPKKISVVEFGANIPTPQNYSIIPFLDKSKKEDLKKLCDILSESHFLVLPTQFDAFGIVFCEASAYAMPSITANVGGVGQAVKDGKNGFLLPPDATASDYAKKIKILFNDKENYLKLRQSARNEFDTRLNWDVWGEKVNKILEDAVTEWKKEK